MSSSPVQLRPRRSVLYMPASNQKAIDKARTLPCDAVILDLEDAVAPEAKDAARDQALAAIRAGGFGRRELILRVNGLETPWGEADLAAACQVQGLDAVLVPKINDAGDVARYDGRLSHAARETRLWAMIEPGRAPNVRRMAISACLSVTAMTSVETRLNAATATISERMMNIMVFSICTARKKLAWLCVQSFR